MCDGDIPLCDSVSISGHHGNFSGHPPEVLTILRATDWAAQLTASKLGMLSGNLGWADGSGSGSPTRGSPNSVFNWDQVGVAITWFAMAVDKHAKAQASSNDKEWTSKSRASKMPEWIRTMVMNASELIPDGMTDNNGDPITTPCQAWMLPTST